MRISALCRKSVLWESVNAEAKTLQTRKKQEVYSNANKYQLEASDMITIKSLKNYNVDTFN